ncbi:MAG: hypothetical protein ACOYBY_02865 [Dermatophilaceae bacterium]
MPTMHVLMDEQGRILGTAEQRTGSERAPSARLVARPGQAVVEMDVSDEEARLAAPALLDALAARRRSGS